MCRIGMGYFQLSDFAKSFENYKSALLIYEDIENLEGIRICYSYLGILLSTIGNKNDAIFYFNKALNISEKLNDKFSYAIQLGNIGRVYFEMKNYKQALDYYEKAIRIFDEIDDKFNHSIFTANAGLAFMKLRDYNRAYFNFRTALKYSESINNDRRIAYQNGNLGELKLNMATDKKLQNSEIGKKQLIQESIKYFDIALSKFTELGIKEEIKNYQLFLSQAYEENGEYYKSLAFFKSARTLQDSIYSVENKKKIAQLEVAQQMKLKEKEIELLVEAKEYQEFVKWTFISFAILLFLISLAFIVMFINKRKKNIELNENIRIREITENQLVKNEKELKKHQEHLEEIVKLRTKKLEEEIKERKRTEEDLILAIDRSETSNKAKSTFLANMSHELRTPLFGILGYSELLSSEIKDPDERTMAEGIYRTGSRLLNTLSMILDFARVESDMYEINYREVNIIPEISDIFNAFKGVASIKDLEYKLKVHKETEMLFIDLSMIRVITENLINNAIKFTEFGSVIVETEIENNNGKEVFLLRVRDTGIGIKKTNIPVIFKEFKQISEGTNKAYPGTGLGLSITKKYVEILKGEISVKTSEGFGSTFEVRLSKNEVIVRQSA